MKTLILFSSTVLLVHNLYANGEDLSWVDTQVEAIKPERSGIKTRSISKLRDPFIFLEKNKLSKEDEKQIKPSNTISSQTNTQEVVPDSTVKKPIVRKGLVLDAVINKSALISGVWYRLNDKVKSYTLTEVHRTSVVLSNGAKTMILTTNSENKTLQVKNR